MDLGEFQEQIGGLTTPQILLIFVGCCSCLASALMTQSAVYMSGLPNHRCAVPPIDSSFNLTEDEIKNFTIPYDETSNTYSQCLRKAYNLSYCESVNDLSCLANQGPVTDMKCDYGYKYDTDVFIITPITEWDLVCDREYLDSLANTIFFLGYFVGSLFIGPAADWYGRKKALLVTSFGMIITALVCSFMPTYESYVAMRALVAAFTIANYISNFTYTCEIAGVKRRLEAVVGINLCAALSHTAYPWICYAFKKWRPIHFVISLVGLPSFFMIFFIPESPVWLLTKSRYNEAREVLGKFSSSTGHELNDKTWSKIVQHIEMKKKNDEQNSARKKVGIWELFQRPLMCVMCLITMFCWFTCSMVFYGLVLNAGNLSGDFYLNSSLNAVVEVVGYFLPYYSNRFGRKPTQCFAFIAAGSFCICSMLTTFFGSDTTAISTTSTVLAITGKLFATTAFSMVYSVTSEVFPSNARTTAISLGSMTSRVGSMISPFVLQLQSSLPWFTQTLFGTFSILSGAATMLYPETNNVEFIDNLDQAEEFYKKNIFLVKWWNSRNKTKTALEAEQLSQVNPTFKGDNSTEIVSDYL